MSGKRNRASELRAIADGRLLLNVRNGVTVSRSMLAMIADELDATTTRIAALEAKLAEAREALAESDRQAEKLEALLDPYIAWEGKPAKAYAELTEALQKAEADAARMREALREAVAALDQAREDVACWGSYAGEYFQDKHDLEGDLDRLAKQASAARRALEGCE